MATRKFLFGGLVIASLLGGGAFLSAQQQEHQTLQGVVSNTHCGLKHSTADAKQAGCVNACIKNQNASYALVSSGKVYTLDGMQEDVSKLAGQSAKITGHLSGMTMKVEKVEAAASM
jgi:hypothetical protein